MAIDHEVGCMNTRHSFTINAKRALFLTFLASIGCGTKSSNSSPAEGFDTGGLSEDHSTAVVTTVAGDYSTGSFATVELNTRNVSDELFITSGDPVVVADDGHIFQINRLGYDNVRRYAPGQWLVPVWEQGVGENSNPHDANICGGQLYITLYDKDYIAVHDLDLGILVGTVDLSAFNDGDEQGPEASKLVEIEGRLYAGLNRLNRNNDWKSEGGVVVEIDCENQEVTRHWDVGGNTKVYPWPGENRLLVTTHASDTESASLITIDPQSDTTTTLVDTENQNIVGLAAFGDRAVGISVADDYSHYAVHCFDLNTGVWSTAEQTDSFLTGVYPNDNGEAWITSGRPWIDLEAPSGIFVYDIETCTSKTDAPVTFSLYPYSLAFY
jgi:hypothetical protein